MYKRQACLAASLAASLASSLTASLGAALAAALGAALGRGALPRLQVLWLDRTGLGSAGLIALAPGLRARPQLKFLGLVFNDIDDDGVAALVAPGEAVLQSLVTLGLSGNQITDAGCAALVAALSSGALPSLKNINLDDNPASFDARAAIDEALAARAWRLLRASVAQDTERQMSGVRDQLLGLPSSSSG